MAPITPPLSQPVLRKRSSSAREDEDDGIFEHSSKRQRIEAPQTPPPEDYLKASTSNLKLPDDTPRQLLMRSVALALEHVGFSGASPEALEAMCSEVDAYAENFLSGVTLSMLNCRRSQPTPLDFKYALSRFQLPILSLQPHLKPPIPTAQLHLEFELAPQVEEQDTKSLTKLLGDDLSGESEKASRAYIPRRFPAFPSKHTYKWTETESKRETDPRKIREEAAKTARQGEEALRRLTKVSKAGKEKEVENIASRDPRSKERHEMWEKAMRDLMAGNRPTTNGMANDDDDRSTIVNSEQVYFRKGVPTKRKAPVAGL